MIMKIAIFETSRQIKQAFDVYKHEVTHIGWFSQIIHRELSRFEVAERSRLLDGLLIKMIAAVNVESIIRNKVQMILLEVLSQSFKELEYYKTLSDEGDEHFSKNQMTRLRTNVSYFVDVIEPHALKLGFLKDVQLTSKDLHDKYLKLAHDCHIKEQWVVQPYNAEFNVASLVEWDDELQQYKLKQNTTSAPSVEQPFKKPRTDCEA